MASVDFIEDVYRGYYRLMTSWPPLHGKGLFVEGRGRKKSQPNGYRALLSIGCGGRVGSVRLFLVRCIYRFTDGRDECSCRAPFLSTHQKRDREYIYNRTSNQPGGETVK